MAKAIVTTDQKAIKELQKQADQLLDAVTSDNFELKMREYSNIQLKIKAARDRIKFANSKSQAMDWGYKLTTNQNNTL